MNFDNYRYFAAAAEELNFTKAARKLFMTQQALSKQIDKMEKEYKISSSTSDSIFFPLATLPSVVVLALPRTTTLIG